MAANSEATSIASSPWDMQTNAQSQRQFEEEVKKQRRNCDWIENRATLDVEECSFQASRDRVEIQEGEDFQSQKCNIEECCSPI